MYYLPITWHVITGEDAKINVPANAPYFFTFHKILYSNMRSKEVRNSREARLGVSSVKMVKHRAKHERDCLMRSDLRLKPRPQGGAQARLKMDTGEADWSRSFPYPISRHAKAKFVISRNTCASISLTCSRLASWFSIPLTESQTYTHIHIHVHTKLS